MSDGIRPQISAAQILKAGASVQQLAGTIYDKVNNAEATAQYMNATEAMNKRLAQFRDSLATDQNWQGYTDKFETEFQSAQDEIMGGVTNHDAKQSLAQDFANIKNQQYSQVSKLATDTRIGVAHDQMVVSLDSATNSLDKEKVNEILTQGARQGLFTQPWADDQKQKRNDAIDVASLTKIGMATGNVDDALKAVYDSQNVPTLSQVKRDAVARAVKDQFDYISGEQKKQWDEQNSGILNQAMKEDTQGKLSPGRAGQYQDAMVGSEESKKPFIEKLQAISATHGLAAEANSDAWISWGNDQYNKGQPLGEKQRADLQERLLYMHSHRQITDAEWDKGKKDLEEAKAGDPVKSNYNFQKDVEGLTPGGVDLTLPENFNLKADVDMAATVLHHQWVENGWATGDQGATRNDQVQAAKEIKDWTVNKVISRNIEAMYSATERKSNPAELVKTIQRFGGGEIAAMADAGNPEANRIRSMAKDDFQRVFPDVHGVIKVLPISQDDPGVKTVIKLEDEAGLQYVLAMDDQGQLTWQKRDPALMGRGSGWSIMIRHPQIAGTTTEIRP